jgi:HemY protein
LALANAALEAHEFAEARASLAPLAATPSRRVATLMARIEAAEHGDTGLAREWMARAVHAAHDPAWTADGVIAEAWMPVSPVTGRLDAFQWRVPVADLTPRGATVEQTPQPLPAPVSPQPSPSAAAPLVTETTLSPSLRPAGQSHGLSTHAPDDPGPDPERPVEPVPRPAGNNTQKTRSWFSRAAVK